MGNINIANLPTTKQETASGNCTVLCTHCPSEHDKTYWIGIHFHSLTVTFSFLVLLLFPGRQNTFFIDSSDFPSSPFSFVVLSLFPGRQNIFFIDSSCPSFSLPFSTVCLLYTTIFGTGNSKVNALWCIFPGLKYSKRVILSCSPWSLRAA